jgi:hypothetical protein
MRFSWSRGFAHIAIALLCLSAEGCMGWADIFAQKHTLIGDFGLMQGESAKMEVYLMSKEQSVSVAGPLHQLGWNEQYIIFTDDNWPKPWNVIRVSDHARFTITDGQRTSDPSFKGISIMSPTDAWNSKKR